MKVSPVPSRVPRSIRHGRLAASSGTIRILSRPSRVKLLFVDDDPNVLESLRDSLHRYRRVWDVLLAPHAEAALDIVARTSVDVVVTDLRMPGMSGTDLLRRLIAEHPSIVRIVLTGVSDLGNSAVALALSHRFLVKPCETRELASVIERSLALRTSARDPRLLELVGRVKSLPSPPRVYAELLDAVESRKTSAEAVARVLEKDGALCARLLQVANSALIGARRSIGNVKQAVNLLGVNVIRSLALSASVFSGVAPRARTFDLKAAQTHSVRVARIPAGIAADPVEKQHALTAGLLHDIGSLVVASELPQEYDRISEATRAGASHFEAELEALGARTSELGGLLLGFWGLPDTVVEAVAFHDCPAALRSRSLDLAGVLHVADALVHDRDRLAKPMPLDTHWLESVGAAHRLPSWRAHVENI